ncbi:MAG: hypothetical protein RLZZ436_4688, partial [Planctomycetota bacterium]
LLLALSFLCTPIASLQAVSIPLVLAAAVLFAAVRVARAFQDSSSRGERDMVAPG